MASRRRRKLTGLNPIGRNPWALLALLLLAIGLAVHVFHSHKGTQRDPQRELRKF